MQSLFPTKPFEIKYKTTSINFTPVDMPGRIAFQANFSSSRKPLLVLRAKDYNGDWFWTSMPEGRQREAEGVGELIEQYIKEHPIE
jgi:hypothetical protein